MDTTYVISLDALDLKVLPFTYQPRRHIAPIWSFRRNDELCEFRIRTNNTSASVQSVTDTTINTKNEDEDKFDLENYIKILQNNYEMPMMLKVIDEETVGIEIKGNKVEVATENFLGLKTIDSEYIECVLCKAVIAEKEKVKHLMSTEHMDKVSTPVKDIHCKREIYPLWHHCVLCNVIVNNYNFHIISNPVHDRRLQKAIKYKNHDNATQNSKSSENLTVMVKKNNKSDAITKMDFSLDNKNGIPDRANNRMDMESKDDDSPSTANKTFCRHCNAYICNNNLRKHINTKNHLRNTKSKLYYLYKTDMHITSCRVCNVEVKDVIDFEKHVNLSEHDKNYKKLLATNKMYKMDNNELFCKICYKIVFVKNELSHIEESVHMEKLNPNKHLSTSSDLCNICALLAKNKDNIKKIKSNDKDTTHNFNKITSDSVSVEEKDINQIIMEETHGPSFINCSVCDVLFQKDQKLATTHKEVVNVEKNMKFLRKHYLVLQDDNIYCNICNVFVGLNGEIIHVKGKKHLKNLRKAEPKPSTSRSVKNNAELVARIKARIQPNSRQIIESGVRVMDQDVNLILEHYYVITASFKGIICKTCKVTVPLTIYDSRSHLEGSKHKKKLIAMTIINRSTSASNIGSKNVSQNH